MNRHRLLHDEQWERIKNLLPGKAHYRGVTARDNRQFVEAVLWITRTSSPWRDLSEIYSHWKPMCITVASHAQAWVQIMEVLATDADTWNI